MKKNVNFPKSELKRFNYHMFTGIKKLASKEDKNKYHRVHMGNLLPDMKSPCHLFLKFKGKVIPIIKEGASVDIEFINRMESNDIFFALILKTDVLKWDKWLKKGSPSEKLLSGFLYKRVRT